MNVRRFDEAAAVMAALAAGVWRATPSVIGEPDGAGN